ncbi:DUF3859 domain-containing protein [Seohaeicola zhoushanensis]|uniref:DUF3859 domain-containing protein n=1 Tax=Seohaeicola zhoushanensis TaxID=1569283 RepID=A0A8J3MBU5_9RHOB|nr:DUF3859 domain-containing protein [Seohaeicola zhoushanensis]GHF68386.1 hypothetical protein GCM10017056_44400 [Seohaeicola zhoushanensis]
MIRRLAPLCLALLPLPLSAGGVEHRADTLLKLEFGAFCQLASVDSVEAPDTLAQRVDLLPVTPPIRWHGPVVPAKAGLSFGVRTETGGLQMYPVTIEVTHPPFLGSGMTHQSYVTTLGGDDASINAYSFDLPEEMVTGTWTIRALFGGEPLYVVSFEVVRPEDAPWIGQDCGADYLS